MEVISCKLHYYTVSNNRYNNATFSLPANQWHQISLPYAPPANANTVADILSDDFTGTINTDWAVYKYNAATSSYVALTMNDIMEQGIGYWVDGSVKSTPEVEFEDVETASKFKKAVEVLASGDIEERLSKIEEKVENLERSLEEKMVDVVALGVQKATEQLVTVMLTGQRPVQDQLNEMWKRIADMQEALNLFMMYQIADKNGDKELAEALFKKLVRKLNLLQP